MENPEIRLKALSIAASVFSQITKSSIEKTTTTGEDVYTLSETKPRTLKDFRGSVDAVFKAAGLGKVEWNAE